MIILATIGIAFGAFVIGYNVGHDAGTCNALDTMEDHAPSSVVSRVAREIGADR